MVLIVLAGPTRAQERPFPYTVSKRDIVILPVSLGISLLGDSEAAKYRAPLTMEEIERRAILDALEKTDGNRTQAADLRNMSFYGTIDASVECRGTARHLDRIQTIGEE